MSLAGKIYLSLMVASLIVLTLFFGVMWWSESQLLERLLIQNGKSLLQGFEENVRLGMKLRDARFIMESSKAIQALPDVRMFEVYDERGQRLVRIKGKQKEAPMSWRRLVELIQHTDAHVSVNGGHLERFARIVHDGEETLGYIVMDLDRSSVSKAFISFIGSVLVALFILWGTFALVIWWVFSRNFTRSLNQLLKATESVSQGNLQVQVNENVPAPLDRIARSFNEMAQSLLKERSSLQERSQALMASEKRYRELFTNMPIAMYVAKMSGRLLICNPAMAKLFGYESIEDFLEKTHFIQHLFSTPSDRDKLVQDLLESRQVIRREVTLVNKESQNLHCVLFARLVTTPDGRPVGVEGLIQDLTELRILEDSLVQAQKMEAIGELAGGIAHDFNNILAAILGNAGLLSAKLQHPDQKKYVQRIIQAAERAADLTKNLLGFARKGEMRRENINVVHILSDVISLIAETADRRINIIKDFTEKPAIVSGDASQLHQVFMNLVINALQAMPNGGILHCIVDCEAESVVVRIADTGIGMSEETMKRIFDPFFTTKKQGEGSGLGLSMVFGIVQRMQGSIDVQSTPGEGSEFIIRLPLSHSAMENEETMSMSEEKPRSIAGAHILIVDDENALLELGKEILEEAGYVVRCTDRGEKMLQILDDGEFSPDLVLLDVNMPGMGGVSALEELKKRWPHVKVMIISGYSESVIDDQTKGLLCDGIVTKPFQPEQLCHRIIEVLCEESEAEVH